VPLLPPAAPVDLDTGVFCGLLDDEPGVVAPPGALLVDVLCCLSEGVREGVDPAAGGVGEVDFCGGLLFPAPGFKLDLELPAALLFPAELLCEGVAGSLLAESPGVLGGGGVGVLDVDPVSLLEAALDGLLDTLDEDDCTDSALLDELFPPPAEGESN